jgi:hypothetical protein
MASLVYCRTALRRGDCAFTADFRKSRESVQIYTPLSSQLRQKWQKSAKEYGEIGFPHIESHFPHEEPGFPDGDWRFPHI